MLINFIQGGISKDSRGQIRFVNDFDMQLVKRFYIIKNVDNELTRGWRAHRIEQRWFYVLSGSFELSVVKIDNWEKPSVDLAVDKIIISAAEMKVIHIPSGYSTAFRALELQSELLVFADYSIEHASKDDYVWDLDYFINF